MVNNLNLTENITGQIVSPPRRRYLLVARNVYGKEYIPVHEEIVSQKQAIKKSRLFLSEIDHITASCHDEEDLLRKYGLYDFKAPTKVGIEYRSNGRIKTLPVIYDDEVLARIAKESGVEVVRNRDTEDVFEELKNQLVSNKYKIVKQLMYSIERVTDPVIRGILLESLESKESLVNYEQLNNGLHAHYKQWRTVYNHIRKK